MDSLIAAFRAGEPAAVRAVYQQYAGPVATVARSVVGADQALIDDIVQQTFTKAWQAADRFDAGRELAPWLYAIARRTAIDVIRHERRPTIGGHEAEVEVSVGGTSMEQTWEAFEVRQALGQLPADEKMVVMLGHVGGLSHQEIADRLGVPVGTVKSRSHRAHRRLAAALGHLDRGSDGSRGPAPPAPPVRPGLSPRPVSPSSANPEGTDNVLWRRDDQP